MKKKFRSIQFDFRTTQEIDIRFDEIRSNQKFSGYTPPEKPTLRRPKTRRGRKLQPDYQMDLHGETKEVAIRKTTNKIEQLRGKSGCSLLIITGKGLNSGERGGVLKTAITEWLSGYGPGTIREFREAPPYLGGSGAILVFF